MVQIGTANFLGFAMMSCLAREDEIDVFLEAKVDQG